jgi:hypothetical protein
MASRWSSDVNDGDVWISEPVRQVRELYGDLVGGAALVQTRFEHVQVLADRLADGHRRHHPGAYVELVNWNPALGGLRPEQLWARWLDRSDVVLAVARARGYDDVDQVVSDDVVPSATYETAVDTMLAGDLDGLQTLLDDEPDLTAHVSHWPHRATLLHYATANGVEIHRQVVPRNLPTIVALLTDRGADVNASAHAYGSEVAVLGLLLSSSHPRDAGVTAEVAAVLRAAGAR